MGTMITTYLSRHHSASMSCLHTRYSCTMPEEVHDKPEGGAIPHTSKAMVQLTCTIAVYIGWH